MKAKRPSKEIVKARVDEVARILLDGATRQLDIPDFVREHEIDPASPWYAGDGDRLSYSQIRRYIEKAERLISQIVHGDRKELLDLAIAQRQNLFAKCVAIADYRAALSVLQDRDRLLDLYPARRTEHTGAHGEALYPSLSTMLVAIVKQEAQQLNGDDRPIIPIPILGVDNDDTRSESRNAAPSLGSEEMPRLPPVLHEHVLQNSGIG